MNRVPFPCRIATMLALFLFVAATLAASEQKAPPVPAKPRDGVYAFFTGYGSMVLELKNGRYRCWSESDAAPINPPPLPLEGTFATDGEIITLQGEGLPEKQWSFVEFNGATCLWRSGALKLYRETGRLDRFGILYPTDKSAEEAWRLRSEAFLRGDSAPKRPNQPRGEAPSGLIRR